MLGGNIDLFCCHKEIQSTVNSRLYGLLDYCLSAPNLLFIALLLTMGHFSLATLYNVKLFSKGCSRDIGRSKGFFFSWYWYILLLLLQSKVAGSSRGTTGAQHKQVSPLAPWMSSPSTTEGSSVGSSNGTANLSTKPWAMIMCSLKGTGSQLSKEKGLQLGPLPQL